eukprot:jgi/Chlat1/5769/Chrsp387S09017
MAGSRRRAKRNRAPVRVALKRDLKKRPLKPPQLPKAAAAVLAADGDADWDPAATAAANYAAFGLSTLRPSSRAAATTRQQAEVGDEQLQEDATRELARALGAVPRVGPPPRLTAMQRVYIGRLVAAHGDDHQAMARDTKLNALQHTAAALRKLQPVAAKLPFYLRKEAKKKKMAMGRLSSIAALRCGQETLLASKTMDAYSRGIYKIVSQHFTPLEVRREPEQRGEERNVGDQHRPSAQLVIAEVVPPPGRVNGVVVLDGTLFSSGELAVEASSTLYMESAAAAVRAAASAEALSRRCAAAIHATVARRLISTTSASQGISCRAITPPTLHYTPGHTTTTAADVAADMASRTVIRIQSAAPYNLAVDSDQKLQTLTQSGQ